MAPTQVFALIMNNIEYLPSTRHRAKRLLRNNPVCSVALSVVNVREKCMQATRGYVTCPVLHSCQFQAG